MSEQYTTASFDCISSATAARRPNSVQARNQAMLRNGAQEISRNWHPASLDLNCGEFIGKGASGQIFRGRLCQAPTDGEASLKIPEIVVKFPQELTWKSQRVLRHEYRVMRRLQHPAIARVFGLKRFGSHLGIVMERLQAQSIVEALRSQLPPGVLPDLRLVCETLAPLVDALVAMHDRGWAHGDLKPDHIMWRQDGQPVWVDFETSTQQVRPHWERTRSTLSGTFEYLAPEAISAQAPQPPADIFSLGRILAQVLCGRSPTWDPDCSAEECDQRIISQLPDDTPHDLAQMCALMVRQSPAQRPSARNILRTLLQFVARNKIDWAISNQEESEVTKRDQEQLDLRYRRAIARVTASPRRACPPVTLAYCHESDLERIEQHLYLAQGDEPRLVVRTHADHPAAAGFSALEGLWGQLADWLSIVPEELRRNWEPPCEDALAVSASELSEAFGGQPVFDRDPDILEIEQASNCIVRMLESIAQQRRVVLVIHRLEWIDRDSARCLQQLLNIGRRSNIAIFATSCSESELHRNNSAQPLVRMASECR